MSNLVKPNQQIRGNLTNGFFIAKAGRQVDELRDDVIGGDNGAD